MKAFLILACLATVALGCSNTCPGESGGNGNGQCQPVKINYSANGVCLNVEVGCPGDNGNTTPPPAKYEKCGSCNGQSYGRVPLDGDCSQFCECIQGQHSKIDSCPEGLSFNAKKQVCDFPENSGCENVVTVTPTPPTDNPAYCESCKGITYGFVAFERNCSKFCECLRDEVSKVKDCEPGLLFNKDINNCDYAENTDCQDRPTDPTVSTPKVTTPNGGSTPKPTTPSGGSTPKPTTPSGGSTPKPTTPKSTPKPTTPTVVTPQGEECIKCNKVQYGVVADGDDCRKFCICYDYDGLEVHTCSEGLWFNPESEVCEYDTEEVCKDGTTGTPTGGQTPTPTPKPTPTSPTPEVPDGTDGNCKLCDQANLGKLVPVEGDCTKYCVCQYFSNQGRNTIVTCPAGLYFNQELQVCDWPLNSGCVQKSVPA